MSTHSIAQPITIMQAAEGYLPWGRDVRDWVRYMRGQSNFDRDQLRKLRAARAVLEGSLSEINLMLKGDQDETPEGSEAVSVQA